MDQIVPSDACILILTIVMGTEGSSIGTSQCLTIGAPY